MEAQTLLAWYDRHRRALPWRERPEPYRVWVSEVMLQQTQVATAIPYFERFVDRFPTVEALAAAEEAEVLALWSGLGYYRRARQLLAAAREVVAAGGLPRTARGLEELPGIGPYTAAAIASIAFGEAVPVLDGNVARVLARRLAEPADPAGATTRRRLLAAAGELLDPARPGDSNQALMELGATLCTPRSPRCPACPLAAGCRARATGRPEAYPRPRAVATPERVRLVAALTAGGEGWLLVRRPVAAAQLAGLWEFPVVEAATRPRAERLLGERWGGEWRLGEVVARLDHAITRRRYALVARRAAWSSPGVVAEGPEAGWFSPAAARELALTGVARKLLARL